MELSQHNLLEELIMAPKIDTLQYFPNELLFPNAWTLTAPSFDHHHHHHHHQAPDLHFPASATNPPSLLELISPSESNDLSYPFGEFQPLLDALTSQEFGALYERDDLPPLPIQDEYLDNAEAGFLGVNGFFEEQMSCYKVESGGTALADDFTNVESVNSVHNVGDCGEKKCKSKKPDGQPSKNLMAERRRRKRLNDRLSMLRSIVPKISKMDRTSILGDTIDYMKELLDKIHNLREEGLDDNVNLIGNYLKELKPNEMLVRNPPKFDVERRNQDTRVEVCCAPKPGLLLSTLSTLDALGLEIQQCVISCFNDFSLHASCFEATEHRSLVCSEDVKQELFRNAGYGGRCL